jgi:hypothetical protein
VRGQLIVAYEAAVAALIEPFDIDDVHVSGLGRVEFLSSGDARFVFYSERNGERVAKFALIMNVAAAINGTTMFTAAITGGVACDGPCLKRRVRLAH